MHHIEDTTNSSYLRQSYFHALTKQRNKMHKRDTTTGACRRESYYYA